MINDEANNNHYFAVKNLLELNSSGWLQGKNDVIKNNNNFQNALNDALNYHTIENNPQRISKLKPYIDNYNWEGTKVPAESKEWQKFEQNNDTIALDVLYVEQYTNKITPAYKSKYNNTSKKQVVYWWLVMVENIITLL